MTGVVRRVPGYVVLAVGMLACAWAGPAGASPPDALGLLDPAQRPGELPSFAGAGELSAPGDLVVEVRLLGNESVDVEQISRQVRTRAQQPFDPDQLQADARRLMRSGMFQNVVPRTQRVPGGVIVTFELVERPTIRYIRFLGNRRLSDRELLRQSGLKEGEALNLYGVREARRKIEEYYRSRGFSRAQVEVLEGERPDDRGVALVISEGQMERVWSVDFVGNTLVTDGRLQTQVQSKRGWLWPVGLVLPAASSKVDVSKINDDVDRLTAYYRGLGYFLARVGRELVYDDSGNWVTIRFVIDEGPRYHVRSVSVRGNRRFDDADLLAELQLQPGEPFDLRKMQRDERTLSDVYGGHGHVFAAINSAPRFVEEVPELDLVYEIEEGGVFAVGQINVHIEGETPHTRESVVLNRISQRPGDIIDVREIRRSERRLKASQLFEFDPSQGIEPHIVIRPPEFPGPARR